jgi:hypothetical protein
VNTHGTPGSHDRLGRLAALEGTWRGHGRGEYPTIEPFGYVEEITFVDTGRPFLVYAQRTEAADDGRPLHAESGYWRTVPGDPPGVELALAHPTGLTELLSGHWQGDRLELTGAVTMSPTAKEVRATERTFELEPATGELRYAFRMAAVGEPMTHHLAAVLQRVA